MLHFYYTELYLLLEYFSSTQMFQKQEENLVKNYQWLLMKTKKTLDFWNKKIHLRNIVFYSGGYWIDNDIGRL